MLVLLSIHIISLLLLLTILFLLFLPSFFVSYLNLVLNEHSVLVLPLLVQTLNFRHHLIVVLNNLLLFVLLLDQFSVLILLILLDLKGHIRSNRLLQEFLLSLILLSLLNEFESLSVRVYWHLKDSFPVYNFHVSLGDRP